MGCFSYICQGCCTPINSTSFAGEACELFLLRDGKVVESMQGNYDSYGRVFGAKWNANWGDIVELHFDDNAGDGIAAFHQVCRRGKVPIVHSKNDPRQGWGRLRRKYMQETAPSRTGASERRKDRER